MISKIFSRKAYIIILAIIVLCPSCTDESESYIKGEEVSVTFSLRIPDIQATRALTEVEENAVSEIDILLFDSGTEAFIGNIFIPASGIQTGTYENIKKFDITLRGGEYDMVILANSHAEVTAQSIPAGTSRQDIIPALLKEVSQFGISNTTAIPFPMYGEYKGLVVNSNLDMSNEIIYMLRGVVRIDVKLGENFSVGDKTNASKKLASVRLYNRYLKGQIIPDESKTVYSAGPNSEIMVNAPSLPAGNLQEWDPIIYASEDGNPVIATIYTFESHQGTYDDLLNNTCLVIGIGDDGETGSVVVSFPNGHQQIQTRSVTRETWYYRIDFMEDQDDRNSYMPLLRNHNYVVEVQAVRSFGFETPEMAFYAESYGVEYEVTPFTVHEAGSYETGKYYSLDISESDIVFPLTSTGTQTITVRTDHPDGVVLGTIPNSAYFSVTVDNPANLGIPNADVFITVTNLNPIAVSWTESFTIIAGNITATIGVSRSL